jgi:hypothetical protein
LILTKLNLPDLLRHELESIHESMDPFCSKSSLNDSNPDDGPCASQFGVITQLVGAVPTQKPVFAERVLNSTVKENITPTARLYPTSNISEIEHKFLEPAKKRNFEQTKSPSTRDTNEMKKPKLCSQTIRTLKTFELTGSADDKITNLEAVPERRVEKPKVQDIASQNMTSQRNSQKPKLTQRQKEQMLNFDNDDLDFDI